MQYLRQSLLTICICLYTFLAIALGLGFLIGRPNGSETIGFYHPDLSFEMLTEIDLPTTGLAPALATEMSSCIGESCL